jgi:copper chaperone CopZ
VDCMTCSSCSGAVESALAATQGVKHASVSLTLQEAKVEYDPELTDEVGNNPRNGSHVVFCRGCHS